MGLTSRPAFHHGIGLFLEELPVGNHHEAEGVHAVVQDMHVEASVAGLGVPGGDVDVPVFQHQQFGVDVEVLRRLTAQLADGDTVPGDVGTVNFRASASGNGDGIILCLGPIRPRR